MSSRIEQIIEEIEEYVDSCKYQPLSTTKIVVNKEEIEEETRNILDEAGTTGVVLGADCTIPRDTDVNHLAWVREAADRYGK